jgi:hypothetical protein
MYDRVIAGFLLLMGPKSINYILFPIDTYTKEKRELKIRKEKRRASCYERSLFFV